MGMTNTPGITLKGSGDLLPSIGFGSGTKWRIAKSSGETKGVYIDALADQVTNAIQCGFNHIDTAEAYKTYKEVGTGISNAQVPRKTLWITDKYTPWSWEWRKGSGPLESLTLSLKEMNLDYVDLYMIHVPNITTKTAGIDLKEAWLQMEEIYTRKMARNIGVSNFDVESLEYIKSFAKHQPVVNQIEFSAYMQQQSPGILKYCRENNIVVEGYSPLVPLTKGKPGPLDEILPGIAAKYGKSQLQVLLRWVTQNGIVVITTTGKKERLNESLNIFDFELSKEDFDQITNVGREKILRNYMHMLYEKYDDNLYADLE